jgi:hypothetical protein
MLFSMQITTIHKLQYILDIAIKMLKLAVRHLLTLLAVLIVVAGLLNGKVIADSAPFGFLIAIILDKAKMNWKLSAYPGHQFSVTSSLHHNSLANHSIEGNVFNSPHNIPLSIHHTSMTHTSCNNLHRENDNWYYHSLVNPNSTLSRHFE